MDPDEQQPRSQSTPRAFNPDASNPDAQVAATLAALATRVDALERELALLRTHPITSAPHPAAASSPPPLPSAIPKPKASLEDRIGSQLFSRIGIVALLIATALFLKWAIDNQWVGPLGRILAGLIAGAAVILWSERFRCHGFPTFASSLKAIGSGALYLSLWAAFQLYHLLPAAAALIAMVLVTAWNAFMAWSQNSELLAAYALAGAFVTPLLLYDGGDHEIFLFSYLLTIDIATVILVRLKPWPRLLLGAFPASAAYFIAWYIGWYNSSSAVRPTAVTILFLALFLLTFIIPSLRAPAAGEATYNPLPEVFLPLANASFTAFAAYFVLQDAGYHDLLPWVAVLLAAFYLGLMRLPQTRVTSALHLSLSIVFLTIAIPLKATGHWITIGWLAEGVALLWISTRLTSRATTDPTIHTQATTRVPPLRSLIAAKVGHRASDPLSSTRKIHSTPSATLRRLATLALTLGFLGLLLQTLWLDSIPQTPFLNSRFATALFGIAAFAISAAISLRAHRRQEDSSAPSQLTITAASIVALNLTAILACVHELETIWPSATGDPDADLQRSLAISAFLMLYGAVLLAIGFSKRSAFLRWQALILLVFTIGKAFLYDLRNLSQGYRVLSFLGLGALLMAVSFAYQKDWLALRDPQPSPAAASTETGEQGLQNAEERDADEIEHEEGANP